MPSEQTDDLDKTLIDLYESAMLHGEAQANGVAPTQLQRERTILVARGAIVRMVNEARIDELEHIYCCDCEPVVSDGKEMDVCNGRHIDRIAKLKQIAAVEGKHG